VVALRSLLCGRAASSRLSLLALIPGPVLAVIWGVSYNTLALHFAPNVIGEKHLVSLLITGSASAFVDQLRLPDFSHLSNPKIYSIAVTMAIIASLETLLSIEAVEA
jgi:MFS superfamily sulfate permease-like transporter